LLRNRCAIFIIGIHRFVISRANLAEH
jgi:hypothetical protein